MLRTGRLRPSAPRSGEGTLKEHTTRLQNGLISETEEDTECFKLVSSRLMKFSVSDSESC